MPSRWISFRRRFSAPILVLATFLAAVVLAVGNHVFYWHWHRRRIPDSKTAQEVILTAGSAFAFLVKAFLATAIGTAYAQVLWWTLLRKRLNVGNVDSLSSLLTSAADIMDVELLWRFPLLWMLALVSWLIALSTVFPPGTLSVVVSIKESQNMTFVPAYNWATDSLFNNPSSSLGWGCETNNYTNADSWFYDVGVTNEALGISTVAGLQQQLPHIPTLAMNTSFILNTPGPALQCRDVDPNVIGLGTDQTDSSYPLSCEASFGAPPGNVLGYAAWVPSRHKNGLNDSILPYTDSPDNVLDCPLLTNFGNGSQVSYSNGPLELYVAIQTMSSSLSGSVEYPLGVWNVTHCAVTNATYILNFSSNAETQSVRVIDKVLTELEPISAYLNGTCRDNNIGKPTETEMKIFNYMAMLTLLGELTVGVVSNVDGFPIPTIFSTALARSDELVSFYASAVNGQSDLWGSHIGTSAAQDNNAPSTGPLANGLEALFQNLTLAMYTAPNLLTPREVNVTYWAAQNVYAYAWRRLVISYSIGIGVTAIAAAVGCAMAIESGGSYRTQFSTFLRTVHWHEAETAVLSCEEEGKDAGAGPVPERLKEAFVGLGPSTVSLASNDLESPPGDRISLKDMRSRSSVHASVQERAHDNEGLHMLEGHAE